VQWVFRNFPSRRNAVGNKSEKWFEFVLTGPKTGRIALLRKCPDFVMGLGGIQCGANHPAVRVHI